ncbi:MAG: FecR domain-containing protein [Phycisphaerales bacterium]|nr:FecR domain-containing protein [Phycisphaerales bacterium]
MTMQHARFTLISLCVSMTLGGFAAAADDAPTTTQTVQQSIAPTVPLTRRAVQERLAELKKIAIEAAKALPEGETKVLRAVVMEMAGKVQWRQESTGKWKLAAKDDILKPGAMIRTGLRSWMMLRIGINANVLIDSGSRISLPQIVQAGDTLRTAVQVNRGRADVEVGHVGLTNDFSVLTPSGALAVRGTGLAVAHNALQGTQVFGARTNAMNAIAMKYYGSKVANMLSGEAVSTQAAPNPAVAAALDTVGPAPLNASEAQDQQDAPDQTSQAVSNSDPINGAVRELLAEQQEAINDEILEEEFGDPFLQDGFAWYVGPGGVVLPEDRGAVATGLYWDMKLQYVPHHVDPYNADGHRIASVFEHDLFASTGFFDPEREQFIHGSAEQGYYLDVPWGTELPTGDRPLPETYQALLDFGDAQWSGQPFTSEDDLRTMLTFVNEFCVTTFDGDGNKIEVCRQAFANAMNAIIYNDVYQPGLTPYGQGLQDPYGGGTQEFAGETADCPWCP